MSYVFTSSERAQIQAAIDASTGLISNGDGTYTAIRRTEVRPNQFFIGCALAHRMNYKLRGMNADRNSNIF